jgi:hypothetical protein
MTHSITLDNPQAAHVTLQRLWGWLKPRLLQGQRITLSVEEERRNNSQNALLHATLADIASRREWAGRKWDVLTWKRLLTAAWLRTRGEQVLMVPALDGHGFDVVFEHTSKLSKADMAELIDFIQAWEAMQ